MIMTYKVLMKDPAFTIAITTANSNQAEMSSTAAHVITIDPSFVLWMPLS